MSHLSKLRPLRTHAIAIALVPLACGGLAACGSSSTGTTANAAARNSTSAAAAASAATTKAAATGTSTGSTGSTGSATTNSAAPRGAFAPRFAAMRTCLQKEGITLPSPGSGGHGTGFRNPQLPKGVTRAQYVEALRKCGSAFPGGPGAGTKRRFGSPRFRQALVTFADCLRQNGIPVPQPNTSGKGPIFSTRGLDTTSPKFREARQKCRSTLLTALRSTAQSGTR